MPLFMVESTEGSEYRSSAPEKEKEKELIKTLRSSNSGFACDGEWSEQGLAIRFDKADGTQAIFNLGAPSNSMEELMAAASPVAGRPNVLEMEPSKFSTNLNLRRDMLVEQARDTLFEGMNVVREEVSKLRIYIGEAGKAIKLPDVDATSSHCSGQLIVSLQVTSNAGKMIIRDKKGYTYTVDIGPNKWIAFRAGCEEEMQLGTGETCMVLVYELLMEKGKRCLKRKLKSIENSPLYHLLCQARDSEEFYPEYGCFLGFGGLDDEVKDAAEAAGLEAVQVPIYCKYGGGEIYIGADDRYGDNVNFHMDERPELPTDTGVTWCNQKFKWKHEEGGKYYAIFTYYKAYATLVAIPNLEQRKNKYPVVNGKVAEELKDKFVAVDYAELWESYVGEKGDYEAEAEEGDDNEEESEDEEEDDEE